MIKKIATKLAIIAVTLAAAPIHAQPTAPVQDYAKDCIWYTNGQSALDLTQAYGVSYNGRVVFIYFYGEDYRYQLSRDDFLRLRQEFVNCRRVGQVPLIPKNK